MDFLKSLVISGDGGGASEAAGSSPRETGPRLLRMKRLSLLAMGQTIEEDQEDLGPASCPPPLPRHWARAPAAVSSSSTVSSHRVAPSAPLGWEKRTTRTASALSAPGQRLRGRSHVQHHHRPGAQARRVRHQEPVRRVCRAGRKEDRGGHGRTTGQYGRASHAC
ncbi:uncharacterized protein LOC143523009 [Brachyhypopomus gauderio]|uniref:uncharacterized protein LOC143523009 n=1 Tax=Brachyhypopomus gauderio TaxID=698409 RepID=UPI00404167AA